MKKIVTTLLLGSITLALAACGNESASPDLQQPTPQAQKQVTESKGSVETAYQELFQNSVFLGDSITEGLLHHDILDESSVVAGAGTTTELSLLGGDVDKLAERKPQHVFIMLGSDDILLPLQITDNPKQYSLKFYAELIASIKEKLPKASITVLPITPVTAEAEKKEPRYKNINDYNQGLKELAEKENIRFVDLSPIFSTDSDDLYDSDGVHFKPEFYTRMLDLLKDQVE